MAMETLLVEKTCTSFFEGIDEDGKEIVKTLRIFKRQISCDF